MVETDMVTTHERIAAAAKVVRNLETILDNCIDNECIIIMSRELDRADRRYRALTAELLAEIEEPHRTAVASIGVS
jgi:hypothetical protein